MSEPLAPIDELRHLKFDVISLAEIGAENGSYEQSAKRNAARRIADRLDWVIANLEKAGEGTRNFGLRQVWVSTP